jgi:hypothetical protein
MTDDAIPDAARDAAIEAMRATSLRVVFRLGPLGFLRATAPELRVWQLVCGRVCFAISIDGRP